MDAIERMRMFGGAITTTAVSSLLFTVGVMNPQVPMPLHMVILGWVLSYGFVVVLPLIYFAEFKSHKNRENFGKVILVLLSVLNILYFFDS